MKSNKRKIRIMLLAVGITIASLGCGSKKTETASSGDIIINYLPTNSIILDGMDLSNGPVPYEEFTDKGWDLSTYNTGTINYYLRAVNDFYPGVALEVRSAAPPEELVSGETEENLKAFGINGFKIEADGSEKAFPGISVNGVSIGSTEAEVYELLGEPKTILKQSDIKTIEYSNLAGTGQNFFVTIYNGKVDSMRFAGENV